MLKSLLVASAGLLATAPDAPRASDPLPGTWAVDTVYGPKIRGELSLSRDANGWRATVSGITLRFPAAGDSVRFAIPDGGGEFRGALTGKPGAHVISGFWIQPPGVVLGNSYASPLTLQARGRNTWQGSIVPLDDRFSLYLAVTPGDSGSLAGVFRNPQFNSPGPGLSFRVTRDGDSVRFSAPQKNQPDLVLAGALEGGGRRLTMSWPQIGQTLVLTPRSERQATGLYPRLPRGQTYRYHMPPRTGDGWITGRAAAVGLDEKRLSQLVQAIADTEPTAPRAPLIHSLLVARHGRLVLEEYFYGFDRNQPHDTRSGAKTFASVLVGTAMRTGAPIGPESEVYQLLDKSGPFSNADLRKQQITVANLMTHTSGLACDDNDGASPGNENTMQAQRDRPDWWKYTLDLAMVFDPGTHYAYCSAGMNLVGAALRATTSRWIPELFDRTVARPLRFSRYYYNLMPTGEGYLGGGVRLRPRDWLKVGQAYLDGGSWNGVRLVDSSWVARSTAHQVDNQFGGDGYAWHLNQLQLGEKTFREYEANGNGGQLLMVLPELDIAVVFTAGNYMNGGVWLRFRDQLVPQYVIAAVQDH